ncbi:DUF6440 family protein [Lacticaseibacillus absianus]|uniref:DUF6440 family protein n=1 Tax=Lacticaseibacillus absianus TaxID=2729623 RepID=UPI0015CA0566|nr:DUF6440 family protein [Lacticaseibacillus absianus]
MKDQRFVRVHQETSYAHVIEILVDRQTRVQYLCSTVGVGGGSLVVLVDAQGHPLLYDGSLD